jgi:hypothetical protein
VFAPVEGENSWQAISVETVPALENVAVMVDAPGVVTMPNQMEISWIPWASGSSCMARVHAPKFPAAGTPPPETPVQE